MVFVVAAAVALVAMACGGGGGGKKSIVIPVQVDGKADTFSASFFAYFPSQIQAHPGDEVDFTSVFRGEPHSVTLGKDVDDVFSILAQACPNGGPNEDPNCANGPPAGFADQYNAASNKLPPLIPDNPTDPIPQGSAQPCFLATGDIPTDNSACPEVTQPDFDGTQTVYNSGFLADGAVFKVKLADNIAPGTYNYYCLLHREGMTGTITVVDKDTNIPSADDQKATGDAALADAISKLEPSFTPLASLTPDTAVAGAFSQDVPEGEINEFGPKGSDIAVGGSVTWTVFGAHTISFNAPESARASILIKDESGNWAVNPEALAPAPEGAAGQQPPDPNAPPPDPSAPPTLIDAGEWDGQGFHSSGVILSFGPGDPGYSQYKLTFTQAGTYTYVCLIHPDMEGTVKVG
jgi:plastocyanin